MTEAVGDTAIENWQTRMEQFLRPALRRFEKAFDEARRALR